MSAFRILFFLLAVPVALHPLDLPGAERPIDYPSEDISEIELDLERGYVFFRAGKRNYYWYLSGDTLERLESAALAAEKLGSCESIEIIPARDQSTKRKGVAYDFVSSLVIRLRVPSKRSSRSPE